MSDVTRHECALGPLQVGLRRDLHTTRQETRGGVRYIVHDPITFQNHAFSPLDYRILTAIVPGHNLSEVFERLVDREVLDRDDKQGFYEFVLWLHGIGLLQLPVSRGDVLYNRHVRKQAARRSSWTRFFLSYKIPLLDPDRLLQTTMRWFGWLFSRTGMALWAVLMVCVLWKCGGRLDELFTQTSGMLALSNLPLLWIVLVALKALHEFGHAYACRKFGGSVPEMGIIFILMTPCAYVDASASWKFSKRRHRVAVAFGGMYFESIVAGIFALIWAGTAPGLMHDLALNVVVLASLVTVMLNLNPLMKFDGYYLFSDTVGVFNLQERASRFLKGWVSHWALGQPRPETAYSRGERWLYGMYGPSATLYRIFLAFAITSLVMMQWPGAGLFLGAVFVWALMVKPVVGLFRYLWSAEETEDVRTRARLVAVGAVAATPLIVGFLPVSSSVVVPGVLDPWSRVSVRAPASGFVTEVVAENGEEVRHGDLLFVLSNPELEMRRLRMAGEMDAEGTAFDAVELEDTTKASTHRARLSYLQAAVHELDDQLDSMSIRAIAGGTVVSADLQDWDGRFVRDGDELVQIQSDHRFVRIVLTDYELSRARLEIGSVAEVRWACYPDRVAQAVVREIRRSASRSDVPVALTMLAGGDVYAQPATGEGDIEADQPYLHVFLETDFVPLAARGAGLTARVRLAGRVEMMGGWIRRSLLSFINNWRMS